DAHALVDGDDARLNVTEAIEDRERLRRDVLAAWCKLAVGTSHYLAVFVAISVRSKGSVDVGERLCGVEPGGIMQRRLDRLVTGRKLPGTRRVVHHFARCAQTIDVEDKTFCSAARRHEFNLSQLVRDDLQAHDQHHWRSALLDHN